MLLLLFSGTATGDLTVNLVGAQGVGAAGSFTPSGSPGTGGVVGTGSPGNLAGTDSDSLLGVSAAGSPGSFSLVDSEALTGVQGAGSAGSFVPVDAITGTGVQGVGGVGTFTVLASFFVGVGAVGSAGTFTPTVTVGISGVQAAGSAGVFTPAVLPGFVGVAGNGSPGTFTPGDTESFTGVQGTGSAGTFVPTVSLLPLGVSATGAVGTLTTTGATVTGSVVGVSGTGAIGEITISISTPPGGRPFSASLQRVLNAQYSDEAYLVLAELTHEDIGSPIRVANNTADVTSNGNTFTGFPFEITLPGDEEGAPKATLSINNIDRSLGFIIRSLNSPVRVRLMVVLASDPDTVWLDFKHFWLRNIKYNALSITGDVDSWDFATEPWPNRRASADRAPALFR
jgi:hypothetical protein